MGGIRPAGGELDIGGVAAANDRVHLRAEQESRSFEWLLSRAFAEHLAEGLREKGWTVTIRAHVEDGVGNATDEGRVPGKSDRGAPELEGQTWPGS